MTTANGKKLCRWWGGAIGCPLLQMPSVETTTCLPPPLPLTPLFLLAHLPWHHSPAAPASPSPSDSIHLSCLLASRLLSMHSMACGRIYPTPAHLPRALPPGSYFSLPWPWEPRKRPGAGRGTDPFPLLHRERDLWVLCPGVCSWNPKWDFRGQLLGNLLQIHWRWFHSTIRYFQTCAYVHSTSWVTFLWKNNICWPKLPVRKRGWQRMRWLDGITDSMTWVWANSERQWRTGRPGVLPSTRSQWVRHGPSDWSAKTTC